MATQNNIDQLLSKLDKEQLCTFIKKECARDRLFQDRFLAPGAGSVFTPTPKNYTARVLETIELHSGGNGYVTYNNARDLSYDLEEILDEAENAIKNEQWETAFAALMGFATVGEEILYCGDDSAGYLSGAVENCFDKLQTLSEEERLPKKLKEMFYEQAMTKFTQQHLKGFDWWWNWINMAITLADTQEKQERIIKALDDIINTREEDSWSTEYYIKTAQTYKLEMMSKTGTPEEQRKFMYDNVDNPDFRKRLLQMAWEKKDYDEVLRLAKDGLTHDARYAGLMEDWQRWEFKVYSLRGDKENILRLSRLFFFSNFRWGEKEFTRENMYDVMKATVPAEEWNNYVEVLIQEAIKSRNDMIQLFIYAQEKMWERYMDYIRKNYAIYNFDDTPKEILELYKEEYLHLYGSNITDYFERASNRSAYNYGVCLLRKLIQSGGKAEADKIVQLQINRRPRRPALIDELSRLNEDK